MSDADAERTADLPLPDGNYRARHVGSHLVLHYEGEEIKLAAPTDRGDKMSRPVRFNIAGGQIKDGSIKGD